MPSPFRPPCRFISPDDLRSELDRKLRRDLPLPPELFIEATYRLGFFDQDPGRIYPRLLDFYCSQVMGFYEPARDEMVLVRRHGEDSVQAQTVWVHELTHAAQERRFGLPTRLLAMRHSGDLQRATSAIAEGDATLVMLVLAHPGGGTPDLASLRETQRLIASQADTMPPPPGVPDFFVKDLVFPYAQGLATVITAFERGGWKAVDELLRTPPTSTAALLHPDQPPYGPPLTDADLPPVHRGDETVLTDTMGEWAMAYWLGRQLPAAEARRLAAAWDGDRFRLSRSATGDWAMTMVVRCRNQETCVELADTLRRRGPALLAQLTPGRPVPLAVRQTKKSLTVQAPVQPASPPTP